MKLEFYDFQINYKKRKIVFEKLILVNNIIYVIIFKSVEKLFKFLFSRLLHQNS